MKGQGKGKGKWKGKGQWKGKHSFDHFDQASLQDYCSTELTAEAVLGFGASGMTLRGQFRVADAAVQVAIKTSSNMSELEALKRIASQPALAGVVPVLAVEHQTFCNRFVQILQLASHGTLANVLERKDLKILGAPTFLSILESLATGLMELHKLLILHCDLKPENVAIHCCSSGATLWLIDFGDARLLDDWSQWHLQGPGDPAIHCKVDVRAGHFSEKTDAWCLAQTAAWLWDGWCPSNPAILSVDMPLYCLLSRCLSWTAKERPAVTEVAGTAKAERMLRSDTSQEMLLWNLLDQDP